MKTLYESLLSSTKSKVDTVSKLNAQDLYSEVGFPTESEQRVDVYGHTYYEWIRTDLFEVYGKLLTKWIKGDRYGLGMKIPTPSDPTVFNRIGVCTAVIPHKNRETNKLRRFIIVEFNQLGYNYPLKFGISIEGGSKKLIVKKAYKLLEYIMDEPDLLRDMIQMSIDNPKSPRSELIQKSEEILNKYKIVL